MKISAESETLRVSDLRELKEPDIDELVRDVRTALKSEHTTIEFDLSLLRSADCETVDALMTAYEEIDPGDGALSWRITNPPPDLRQLCELVRMHRLFEITPPRPPRMILL